MAQTPLTQEHFDKVTKGLNSRFEGLKATITANTRDIVSLFNQSQGLENERFDRMDDRFDRIDAKLEAIMEMLAMRKEMRNLVTQLREHGIALNESKIFVA